MTQSMLKQWSEHTSVMLTYQPYIKFIFGTERSNIELLILTPGESAEIPSMQHIVYLYSTSFDSIL